MMYVPTKSRSRTRKRILKLTLVNFILNVIAATYFTLFLLLVAQRQTINFQNLVFTGLLYIYLLLIGLTFYGNGVYVTSITIEDFTPLTFGQ